MPRVNTQDARRNGIGFDGLIDGREKNLVAGDVHDHAPSSEVGNDFVSALAVLSMGDLEGRKTRQEEQTQRDRDNPRTAVCGHFHRCLVRYSPSFGRSNVSLGC
jgi:hypothetical protein